MKRGIAILAVLMLMLAALPAMAQERKAPAGRSLAGTGLQDIISVEESTEAGQESQGMSMWDLTLIGLGICGALLTILLIIALTSKKDVEREYDVKKPPQKR
ncbi:MAG: hypothetical protein J5865_07880 [Lachnospiraceae bacterium]|nr:hypothetical protein [Lachnospiraceae bacterium]